VHDNELRGADGFGQEVCYMFHVLPFIGVIITSLGRILENVIVGIQRNISLIVNQIIKYKVSTSFIFTALPYDESGIYSLVLAVINCNTKAT
jgi:hypothetical protein